MERLAGCCLIVLERPRQRSCRSRKLLENDGSRPIADAALPLYGLHMDAEPEYAMLMQSLTAFRDSVGFHLMDETPLPDDLAAPLWEALDLIRAAIDRLASNHGCVESGLTVYAPSPSDPDDRNGS
ncbi:MAG: hypothetical protein JWN66_1804 [Sphingomonas bacterium]|nr:hypothetical protein [Sphingomonas bacterium]